MVAKTTAQSDLDRLAADTAKIRDQHAAAERKLAEAKAEAERQQVERAQRDREIEHRYATDHLHYKELRDQVRAAQARFVDAVRQGTGEIAAFRDYRVCVATGVALYRANANVINEHVQSERRKKVDQLRQLNQRARDLAAEHRGLLTGPQPVADPAPALMAAQHQTPKPRRTVEQWREAARQWHREAAAFRGNNPDRLTDEQLARLPEPIAEFGPEHQGFPDLPSGPQAVPNPVSTAWKSFGEALDAALTVIEAEQVEAAAAGRAAEIAELQQNG